MNKINGQADTKSKSRQKSAKAISGNEDGSLITKEMVAAGVAVIEQWAVDQPGPISPFFGPLAKQIFAAMERMRLETAHLRIPATRL